MKPPSHHFPPEATQWHRGSRLPVTAPMVFTACFIPKAAPTSTHNTGKCSYINTFQVPFSKMLCLQKMLNRTLPQPPPVISVRQPAMSPVSLSTSVVIWAQDNFRQRTMASVSRQAAWTMMSDVTQTHAWSVRSQSTLGWNQSCKCLPAGSPKKDRRGANLRLAHGNPAVLRTRQGALTHCHQTTPS